MKGFKKRYISTAVDGTDAMLQSGSKRSVKMKGLTVKKETETFIGKVK